MPDLCISLERFLFQENQRAKTKPDVVTPDISPDHQSRFTKNSLEYKRTGAGGKDQRLMTKTHTMLVLQGV